MFETLRLVPNLIAVSPTNGTKRELEEPISKPLKVEDNPVPTHDFDFENILVF